MEDATAQSKPSPMRRRRATKSQPSTFPQTSLQPEKTPSPDLKSDAPLEILSKPETPATQKKRAPKLNEMNARPKNSVAPVARYNKGVIARDQGDLATARVFFEQAAKMGHPEATHNLATLLDPEDPVGACELFQIAAAKGLTEAQYIIGLRMRDGVGIAQNTVEAANHLRRAAAKGHLKAIYSGALSARHSFICSCFDDFGQHIQTRMHVVYAFRGFYV